MNYHNITHIDQNNGDGLRVVLWVAGCSHHCYNCQNPQTWDPKSGILFDESAKGEIFEELSKDYISGLTLSGGDPLYEENLSDIALLVDEITTNFPKKTIWLYTGYRIKIFDENIIDMDTNKAFYWLTAENCNNDKEFKSDYIRKFILNHVDLIVDGPYIEAERDVTLKWRGSKNQRVIDVKKSRKQGEIVLYCD